MVFGVLLDLADDLLCGGEVATVEHDDHTFARCFEHRHFAKRGHMIDTRVGARIRGKHQTFIQDHGHAISHRDLLLMGKVGFYFCVTAHGLRTATGAHAANGAGVFIVQAMCQTDMALVRPIGVAHIKTNPP